MGNPSEDYTPSTPFFDYQYKLGSGLFPTHAPKPRFRLLDKELRLDPAFRQSVRDLESWLASENASISLFRPDWILLEPQWGQVLDLRLKPDFLSKPNPPNPLTMRLPPPPASPQLWPPAYPPLKLDDIWGDPPAKHDVTEVLKAIWEVPEVQKEVKKLRDELLRNIGEDWDNANTPEKIAIVSSTIFVASGVIASIVANKPTRELALKVINGRDIPVPPYVWPGFSVKFLTPDDAQKKGWGAGVTQRELGVKGLSVSGSVQQGDGTATDIRVGVSFDFAPLINNINKKKHGPVKK